LCPEPACSAVGRDGSGPWLIARVPSSRGRLPRAARPGGGR
jgi:hypothetical protein